MAKNPADNSIPPPLRALGGWVEADWFDPAILHQTEVVGMTLPALGGGRKQNFELVERFAQPPAAAKGKKRAAKTDEVKAAAGTIGELIEQAGSTHGAAFRRVKFFFEAPASLFFAAVPAANLKARAADALRKDLIRLAFRGCVLNWGDDGVVAMFWPSSETDVTAFVRAARPAHALHPQFDEAEEERRLAEPVRRGLLGGRAAPPPVVEVAARRPSKSDDKARRLLAAERDRLLEELEQLRGRIVELQASQSTVGAMEALGLDDARLRSMLLLLHPDKHGNSEAANEAAKWVNGLRDVLKARK